MSKFLKSEKSTVLRLGPRTIFRPALPKPPPAGTAWKAEVLNHWSTVCGPALGSPTRFGRSVGPYSPVVEGFAESTTVNGYPLLRVTIPFICQSLSSLLARKCVPFAKPGRFHVPLSTKRCGTSNDDSPRSAVKL